MVLVAGFPQGPEIVIVCTFHRPSAVTVPVFKRSTWWGSRHFLPARPFRLAGPRRVQLRPPARLEPTLNFHEPAVVNFVRGTNGPLPSQPLSGRPTRIGWRPPASQTAERLHRRRRPPLRRRGPAAARATRTGLRASGGGKWLRGLTLALRAEGKCGTPRRPTVERGAHPGSPAGRFLPAPESCAPRGSDSRGGPARQRGGTDAVGHRGPR